MVVLAIREFIFWANYQLCKPARANTPRQMIDRGRIVLHRVKALSVASFVNAKLTHAGAYKHL